MAATTTANVRQAFCEQNFKLRKHDVRWFDVVGMVPLDGERRARLELSTYGTHDHYEGIEVRIVSKATGPVDRKLFLFKDYVSERAGRTDADIEVIGYVGWKWYCDTKPVLAPLIEAIDNYIATWE